jgi:hypothetical protein
VVFCVTRQVCRELKRTERHPLQDWSGAIVTRNTRGGYDEIDQDVVQPAHVERSPTTKP